MRLCLQVWGRSCHIAVIDEDENGDGEPPSKKRRSLIRIGVTVLVERDLQKGIVVGKGGQKIKEFTCITKVSKRGWAWGMT